MQTMLQRLRVGIASAMFLIIGINPALASWDVEHVGSTNIDAGNNCSIALDAQGRPHVAFAAKWSSDLYYACKTGATWTVQTLKTNCYPLDRASISVDTRVRRGSSEVVQPGPVFSASERIERNLSMGKGRPSRPIRSCA